MNFTDAAAKFDHSFSLQDFKSLLPDWFSAWPDSGRQGFMDTVEEFYCEWGIDLLQALTSRLNMNADQLKKGLLCYNAHKRYLDAVAQGPMIEADKVQEEKEAVARRSNALQQLNVFEWKPPGKRGVELLDHMIRHRNTFPTNTGHAQQSASDWSRRVLPDVSHLDLATTAEQLKVVQPTLEEMRVGYILNEVNNGNRPRRAPARRLNSLGHFGGFADIANSPQNLADMKRALNLANNLDLIKKAHKEEDAKKRQRKKELEASRQASVDCAVEQESVLRAALVEAKKLTQEEADEFKTQGS